MHITLNRKDIILFTFLLNITIAYIFEIPFFLLSLFIAIITIYDFYFLYRNYPGEREDAITLLFLFEIIGGIVFINDYYSNKSLWFKKVFIVSLSDIIQYYIGTYYGKRYITNNITLESYLGVLILFPYFDWVILGILGNLFISICKQQLKIKDTSNFLGRWFERCASIYFCLFMTKLYI